MPIDASALLQSRGVQLPDPFQQAASVYQIKDLFNRNQLSNLAVQAQQQTQDAVREFGAAPDFNAVAPQIAQKYPLAYAKMLADRKALEGTQADINAKNAAAIKDTTDARSKALSDIGRAAYDVAQKSAPDAMDMSRVLSMAKFYGIDPASLSPPSVMRGPDDIRSWAATVGAAVTSPLDATNIREKNALLPGQIAQQGATLAGTQASTRETLEGKIPNEQAQALKNQQEAQYVRTNALAHQAEAGAAVSNAATHRADVFGPKVETSAVTGAPVAINRFAPGGPTVADIPGAPQMSPTPGQKALATDSASYITKDLAPKAQAAVQGKQFLSQLRGLDAQGIMNGGIQGSDTFKTLANIAAPVMGQDWAQKMSNTQAWDSTAGELVAQMLKQMGGNRVTNNQLSFMRNIKPNTLQQPGAREMLYDTLNRAFDAQIDTYNTAQQALQKPGAFGLTIGQPSQQRVDSLPDPATHSGYKATAEDGTRYVSDGTRWVRQ